MSFYIIKSVFVKLLLNFCRKKCNMLSACCSQVMVLDNIQAFCAVIQGGGTVYPMPEPFSKMLFGE